MASDGGIFAFGDAGFYGSLGSTPPPTPIVGVAPSPDGGGYWMLEASGTAHAFGDAQSVSVASDSPPLSSMKGPMTGLIPDYSGGGFDSVNASGQAFAYGDAPYFGDVTDRGTWTTPVTSSASLFRPAEAGARSHATAREGRRCRVVTCAGQISSRLLSRCVALLVAFA